MRSYRGILYEWKMKVYFGEPTLRIGIKVITANFIFKPLEIERFKSRIAKFFL